MDKIPHPKFLNADFIFHHEKIVAEFKRVEKDGTDSPKVQTKIATVLEKYYAEAKIKEKQITEENWPGLPKEFQNEIYNITTDSIKVHIEKANKQIKATKENLGLESYKGCLILVNDGVESFPPVTFLWAAFRLILHQYSGITYIITFPANVFAKSREHPAPVQYWLGQTLKRQARWRGRFVKTCSTHGRGLLLIKRGFRRFGENSMTWRGFGKREIYQINFISM